MTAYLGLQYPAYETVRQPLGQVTNDQLENAAPSQAVAKQWILSNNLDYIFVSACDGPASATCRQNMQGGGFGAWRLTHARCSKPLGRRSIGYLTRLLKPQLAEQKFGESFATWEFRLSKCAQDNNALLPDAVTIPVLPNETKGPLQHRLQLQAGNIATCATIRSGDRALQSSIIIQQATSNRIRQPQHPGPAPMDTGTTWCNKGKGKKGKRNGEGKCNNGKGYGGYGNNYHYNNY